MTATIYTIGTGGLSPITTDELEIGQRVIQARNGAAVVTGKTAYGYEITYPNGARSDSQTVRALSPFTRIEAAEPVEILPLAEVEALRRLQREYAEAQRVARDEAATKRERDAARLTAELRRQYPWAVSGEGLSPHARAAKNLKKELSLAFPGIKFSVRSDRFSGGNSIDISWDLGPTAKQVDAIADKYQRGSFNGMEDIYEYDSSAYGDAVDAVLGRAKFVQTARHMGSVWEDAARQLCEIQRMPYTGTNSPTMPNTTDYHWSAGCQANLLFSVTPFPVNFDGRFTVEQNHAEDREHWARIVFPAIEAAPAVASEPVIAEGVTISENEEKNGIEIRFAAKPSPDVLARVKAAGFRWSKFQSLWYAKRTPETRAFAATLAA